MVLIDRPLFRRHGRRFAHLVSDVSLGELHRAASQLGLGRGFHRDHYDVPEELVPAVLARGIPQVDSREIVARLHAAGLR